MLRDLHLLDGLTEGGAITGTVLPNNANLLRALGLGEELQEWSTIHKWLFDGSFSRKNGNYECDINTLPDITDILHIAWQVKIDLEP